MPHVAPLHASDPRRLGRYRLTGRLAGMPADGPVYLAQTPEGSEVSITLLEGDWAEDGAARDRFTAEANAASRVAPFCAARILGAGFEGGHAFLVREYIAGPSLLVLVTDEG
ncbi:MAG TPA: serine/threonine protein kinase, partial [Streptosporangiaceae bacterium]|nr:serine/threonine protein kinase [Streptosporangiaceae bacterium]